MTLLHTTQVLEERLAKRRQVVEYKEEVDKEEKETRDARVTTMKQLLGQKVTNGQLLERQNDELMDSYQCNLNNLYEDINKGNRLSFIPSVYYLLAYAHRSRWSISHQRPPRHRSLFWAALVIPDQLVVCCFSSASVLQCLASNCCEVGLSSSSPAGSRSGLGVRCWMLAS